MGSFTSLNNNSENVSSFGLIFNEFGSNRHDSKSRLDSQPIYQLKPIRSEATVSSDSISSNLVKQIINTDQSSENRLSVPTPRVSLKTSLSDLGSHFGENKTVQSSPYIQKSDRLTSSIKLDQSIERFGKLPLSINQAKARTDLKSLYGSISIADDSSCFGSTNTSELRFLQSTNQSPINKSRKSTNN